MVAGRGLAQLITDGQIINVSLPESNVGGLRFSVSAGADFGLDDARTAERFSFYSTCFKASRPERSPVNPALP